MDFLDEGISSNIGDDCEDKDIDPGLRGFKPQVLDDIFDDEDDDLAWGGDMPGPDHGSDNHTPKSYDEYVTAQVLLQHGGEAKKATVMGRKCNHGQLASITQTHC